MSGTGVPQRFISGVVEGFYGRPWTMEQRTQLFKREQTWGLNTYLYAPKDDYKHRMYWRDLYSAEEGEQLKALISAAHQHDVEFIYALSPGLDVTFSNPKEVSALQRKLAQVQGFGCRSFSLLFDDIEAEMCPADRGAFSSFAHAQVAVTNQVYLHLGQPHTFLFCPTDYCAAFCTPSVSQSAYLLTVGAGLLPGIDVLWTGPKVVSHVISVESIDEVTSVLKRAPVIWDNIHANDYDPQRLFMGPFKDRPSALIPKLRGVLTNPNCEFHPNFVAIHTLATWCRSAQSAGDAGEEDQSYSPQKALSLALTDWLQVFLNPDQPGGPQKKGSPDEEAMQTDVGVYVPGPGDHPLYTAEPLTLADLNLLSELFYLPYEYGPRARSMLQQLDWLRAHSAAAAADNDQSAEWHSQALAFDQMCEAVVQMFTRLSNAPNRRILYDLYDYICDIKSGVGLARAHIKTLGKRGNRGNRGKRGVGLARAHIKTLGGRGARPAAQVLNLDPEPWGFRGGLSGEIQRMLPCHGNRDLFRTPPMTAVYTVRPLRPDDTVTVQRIFKEMQREEGGAATTLQPLMGDGLFSGGPLASGPCALVLEDEEGLCGYALGLPDASHAPPNTQRALWDSLSAVYPSLITMQLLPRVTDPAPAKRMIGCLLSSLKSCGSRGAFCELRPNDRRMLDFYTKLGSFKTLPLAGAPQEVMALGTAL